MKFPLSFWDLTIWLVIASVMLIVAAEVLSPRYGKPNMRIDRKKLKNAGIGTGVLAIISMVILVYSTMLS
jgi:hypothetical protein